MFKKALLAKSYVFFALSFAGAIGLLGTLNSGTCYAADLCECDLNGDGSCNILDWPYFIEDWGRTDCEGPFSGTFNVIHRYDNNISDGVVLEQEPIDIAVTREDSLHLTASLFSTDIPLVDWGRMATIPNHPYEMGDSRLLEFLLLSDGNNMVFTGIGQEAYDPSDISVSVASWRKEPATVSVDDLCGSWEAMGFSDPNLRNTNDGFEGFSESITISSSGPASVLVNLRGDTVTLQVTNGRATLPSSPTDFAGARWHEFTIMGDGSGISFQGVATEILDPTDVSVSVGLGTRN
jgi:hypothetical protein